MLCVGNTRESISAVDLLMYYTYIFFFFDRPEAFNRSAHLSCADQITKKTLHFHWNAIDENSALINDTFWMFLWFVIVIIVRTPTRTTNKMSFYFCNSLKTISRSKKIHLFQRQAAIIVDYQRWWHARRVTFPSRPAVLSVSLFAHFIGNILLCI